MEILVSMKQFVLILMLSGVLFAELGWCQVQLTSAEQVLFLTEEWEGERDQYSRPVVPDDILEKMKFVSLEEAWGTLRSEGYHNKFEVEWQIMYPERIMVGRALTAA